MEFAVILPVFMCLVLGMFSGGLAYNRELSLTSAAREGARYGAVLPVDQSLPPGSTWASSVAAVVVERSTGELDASQVCVALVEGSGAATAVAGTPLRHSTTGAPCYEDNGSDAGLRVQVRVQAPAKIEALFFRMDLTLTSSATARHESAT